MNDFDVFQWVALGVFLSVPGGKSLYMLWVRRVNPFTMLRGKRAGLRWVEGIFVGGLAVWVLEVLAHTTPWQGGVFGPWRVVVLEAAWARWLGAGLTVVGLAILIWAQRSFGDAWRVGIDERAPAGLVTEGIFRHTRNPIYLFFDLYIVGTFLLNGTFALLFCAAVIMAFLHVQIRVEERFLHETYGRAYRDYCERVPRYLSFKALLGR